MPRPPLFPLLRLGAFFTFAVCLLCAPRRSFAPVPAPSLTTDDVIWAADIEDWPAGALTTGAKVTGPLPGQKRPPCAPRAEREVAGACWEPHLERPPCPAGYFEGDGMCLKPVRAVQRPPTSVDP